MRIEWSAKATADLRSICRYIAFDSVQAAKKTTDSILARVANLGMFPQQGHPGTGPGTRELVIPSLPYIAIYRIEDTKIVILRIWHGTQNR